MTRQSLGAIREKAMRCYRHSRDWIVQSSVTVRVVLGFFVLAAVLMAFHTALSSRNSSMQLTVQHGFRNANFSMWVDGEVAYTGTLNGSMKKKFGLLPGSVREACQRPSHSWREAIPLRCRSNSKTGRFCRIVLQENSRRTLNEKWLRPLVRVICPSRGKEQPSRHPRRAQAGLPVTPGLCSLPSEAPSSPRSQGLCCASCPHTFDREKILRLKLSPLLPDSS